ncbi:unnamed protein product [Acanthosepion pharaonis]|uniref:Uncharacterized protein n=1 Tax=Acanthosepion pharaonis TaxID=158019 RepID=A0A812AKA7_ACAPH|nr:unnamed protein product [Sepia pharaonis]
MSEPCLTQFTATRPERRPALIARGLSRLNVDIAALSETRFPGEGSLQEHGARYILFWSGKPAPERRLSGIGFMISTSIAARLENLPTGHSDRIMSMHLPLKNNQKNKDCFDENNQKIQKLLAKKRSAHHSHLGQPSCSVRRAAFCLICSKLREIQNEWWTIIGERNQLFTDLSDYIGFYEALTEVYGPSHRVQSPLRSADGRVLFTDKESILSRWSGYFQALFSADHVVQDPGVLRISTNKAKQNWINYPL